MLCGLIGLYFAAWRVPFAGSEEPGILLQQKNPVIVEDEAQGRLNRHRNNSGDAFLFEQDYCLRKVSAGLSQRFRRFFTGNACLRGDKFHVVVRTSTYS